MPEITVMIDMHHKLRKYRDGCYPLVELFRRGDMVDVTLGLIKWALPGGFIKRVRGGLPRPVSAGVSCSWPEDGSRDTH